MVLFVKLKFIILILVGILVLVGCKDSVEFSGIINLFFKDIGNEIVVILVINLGSGSFEGSVEVVIILINIIVIIYYILDGIIFFIGFSVYCNLIILIESVIIKVMGVMIGVNNSNVVMASIMVILVDFEFILDNNLLIFLVIFN